MSPDTNPPAAEDRFIGVADYNLFLHNPTCATPVPSNSTMEARYRRSLETCMGLGGGGGLMLYSGPCDIASPWEDLFDGGDPPSPLSPPPRAGAATPVMSPTREEPLGGYYTPRRSSSADITVGYTTPCRADEQEPHQQQQQQQQWSAVANNKLRTPVSGSRCGEAYAPTTFMRTGLALHSTPNAQFRTPVRHEKDLLSTPGPMGWGTDGSIPLTESPLPRRSAMHSQHVTPRRQGEISDRVLDAKDICLADADGHPNFNPLCWGHMGTVIALRQAVWLWQSPTKVFSLFEAPSRNLVTAVAQSRHLLETGDIFFAAGLENGLVFVGKYTSNNCTPMAFDETMRVTLRHHNKHVSTLQIVGHRLFSGCMGGVLVVCDLLSGVVLSQHSGTLSHVCPHVVLRAPEVNDNYVNINSDAGCRVNVGAPIYKLEVTPDGKHVAVGTSDSLFVYRTSHLRPDCRKKRRVVMKNASQPVRAFCWWGCPHRNPASSDHMNIGGTFSNPILLYAGGTDGSILSTYSSGNKRSELFHRMTAPILAIISSETSDEIFVSLDVPPHPPQRRATDTTNAVGELIGDHNHHRRCNDNGVSVVGPNDGFSAEMDASDLSSDDESLTQAHFIEWHFPMWPSRRGRGDMLQGQSMRAQTLPRPFSRGEETAVRPALPQLAPSRGGPPAPSTGMLQLFRMRDGGTSVEYISSFRDPKDSSMYIALAPDNAFVATAGRELKLRFWRAFKAKEPERGEPCVFR